MEREPDERDDDPGTLLGDGEKVDRPSIEEERGERLRDELQDDAR